MTSERPPLIRVKSVSPLQPGTEALFDLGKSMLADSISVGREFAKFMIGVATGSIPVYLGLLTLLGVKRTTSWLLFAPPGLMVVSTILFVLAHFPRYGSFSLDVAEEIEAARVRAMSNRDALLYSALAALLVGWSLAAIALVKQGGDQANGAPAVEITTIEIPKNADASEIEKRLAVLKASINSSKRQVALDIREIRTDSTTMLVVFMRTSGME